MSAAVASALLGLGVLAWPVPAAAERRLGRLRAVARVATGGRAAVRPDAPPDRSRAVAAGSVIVAAVAAGSVGGPSRAVAAAAASGAVAVVVLSARAARLQAGRRRDLLTALAVLRGELDAGASFVGALAAARERAGSAVGAFVLADDGARASPRPDALTHARRCLRAGAGLVAVTGASWSAVAAGIGRDVAAHDARDREVAAALAGARASTVVLAGLPVLGLGLAAALGADPVGFLLHTPTGGWVLAAGAVLDLLGVVVSTVVARRAAR